MAETRNEVRYQTVCSRGSGQTVVYGLECLEDRQGSWVRLDLIEDVSTRGENVLAMAERFTALSLSPVHFRDVVMDRLAAL